MQPLFAGAVLVLALSLDAAGITDRRAKDPLVHDAASLTIEMMSAEQQKALWRRAKVYAEYEAVLELCGKGFGLERKAINAVKSCVRKDSLDKLRYYYRKQKAKYREEWKGHKARAGDDFCKSKKITDAMRKIWNIFTRDVKDAAEQCRSCWIC